MNACSSLKKKLRWSYAFIVVLTSHAKEQQFQSINGEIKHLNNTECKKV